MLRESKLQIQSYQYTLQGLLLGLLPASLLSVCAGNPLLPADWNLACGAVASALLICGVRMIFRYPRMGRFLNTLGILLTVFLISFELPDNPLLTLFTALLFSGAMYYLISARLYPAAIVSPELQLDRFLGTAWGLWGLTLISPLFAAHFDIYGVSVYWSLILLLIEFTRFLRLRNYFKHKYLLILTMITVAVGFTLLAHWWNIVLPGFLASMLALAVALRLKHAKLEYLTMLLRHPARSLSLSFLGLCVLGTLLLCTPVAHYGELTVMEAAFTTVSAACVTGLTVIDISTELTLCGRIFLLVIIQLGGLGIMTLAALVLHALGSFSLTGEQLMTEISGGHERDIFYNLRLIVRFTFITEAVCALFLTWGFYNFHNDFLQALELGIFTSISAFCNAGFFPGADNMVPYAGEKLILTIVAWEIVLGGIAPAVTYSLLQRRNIRRQPFIVKLIWGTTLSLLAGGMLLLLLFEWNGIFAGLPFWDKIVNGFFHSATLRTAGFNSVHLTNLGVPAFMVMATWMFVGGSPGGTAGGIKTTVAAVLALTFRTALSGRREVIADQWKIPVGSLIQAVAILIAALLVLFTVILMLVITQDIEPGSLVFEAVSALGTVGLSLGATGELDGVGRIIIMIAMFTGRLGPLTLFLLLSEKQSGRDFGYPEIKIPLG